MPSAEKTGGPQPYAGDAAEAAPAPATTPNFLDRESPQSLEYFRDHFNTPLSEDQETEFQAWLAQRSEAEKRDVSLDLYDYDVRGFWAAGEKPDARGHGTDRFKKPNHPTFSAESIYHDTENPFGKSWRGGVWTENGTFMPSIEMLDTTHPRGYMEWFQKQTVGTPHEFQLQMPGPVY